MDITESGFQTPASKKRKVSGSPILFHMLANPPSCPQFIKIRQNSTRQLRL